MKLFLFTLLAFFSGPLIAGQEGGGGHICELTSQPGVFRTVDELSIAGTVTIQHTYSPDALTGVPSPYTPGVMTVDLLATPAGENFLNKLKRIKDKDPIFAEYILDIAQLLKHVYLSPKNFSPYELNRDDSPVDFDDCEYQNIVAAIVSHKNGLIKIHRDSWNLLSTQSKEILLIHETLRLAQLFTDWYGTPNKAILFDTMTIYRGSNFYLLENSPINDLHWEYSDTLKFYIPYFLSKLENTCDEINQKRLSKKCKELGKESNIKDLKTSLIDFAAKVETKDLVSTFRLLVKASFLQRVLEKNSRYPMSTLFNEFRQEHGPYRKYIERWNYDEIFSESLKSDK